MTAAQMMAQARALLVLDHPFFGALALRLKLVEDASRPTAWTDGSRIGYNPTFIEKLTLEQRIGLVAHEVMHCFPAGTMVAGDDKPIEAFHVGDEVLGTAGRKCRVVETSKRAYSGDLVTIKGRGLLPLKVTTEHPIRVAQMRWVSDSGRKIGGKYLPGRKSRRVFTEPEWKSASSVSTGDWLMVPRIKGTETATTLPVEYGNAWSVAAPIKNGIPLTTETARLLGWYVAEGWTSEHDGDWQVNFALSTDERDVADWMVATIGALGYSARIAECAEANAINVVFSSAPIGRWLRSNCGHGAANKRIPEAILYHHNEEILRAFLQGYIAGDGFHTNHVAFGTVSLSLALQLQLAFARFGALVNLYHRSGKQTVIRGRVVAGGPIVIGQSRGQDVFDALRVERLTIRPTRYAVVTDDYILTPVLSASREAWAGDVYNFETEDHTYTAGNILTHNCASGHPWRRDGRTMRKFNYACVAGETPVRLADGSFTPIRELTAGVDVASPLGANRVRMVTRTKREEMVKLSVEYGRYVITCTNDHLILTPSGFVAAGQISEGSAVVVDAGAEVVRLAESRLHDAVGVVAGAGLHVSSGRVVYQPQRASAHAYRLASDLALADRAGGLGVSGRDRGRRGDDLDRAGDREGEDVLQTARHDHDHVADTGRLGEDVRDVRDQERERERTALLESYGIWMGDRTVASWDAAAFANQEAARGTTDRLYRTAASDAEALRRLAGNAPSVHADQGVERARVTHVERFTSAIDVYDLVTDRHCYVAGGIVVHNCDYAINYIIEESGLKLPEGRLRDPQWDGKSAEWIYARLPEPPEQEGGGGQGSGVPSGGGEDVCDPSDAGAEAVDGCSEAEWQQAVYQAAAAAKSRGTLPAALDRFAKLAAKPKVDWRSVLHRFVQQSAKDDYSWRRPNPRYLAGGFYLPCLHSEAAGPMAVAIDTSGSVDNVTLAQFLAELQSVADDVKPERIHVIYCDAHVGRVDVFERGEQIVLNPVGGGGTCFEPVMDYVDQMEEPPACLVYLTDLMGSHRSEPPAMPVLWATIMDGTVPYGEVVEVK